MKVPCQRTNEMRCESCEGEYHVKHKHQNAISKETKVDIMMDSINRGTRGPFAACRDGDSLSRRT